MNATGIRVFGNALPKDVPEEKTMEQIGKSRIYIVALILMASPFYLNDFANMYVTKAGSGGYL